MFLCIKSHRSHARQIARMLRPTYVQYQPKHPQIFIWHAMDLLGKYKFCFACSNVAAFLKQHVIHKMTENFMDSLAL